MPARKLAPSATPSFERHPLDAGGRWTELLALEHGTLPPPIACSRDGDTLRVTREPIAGHRLGDGRVPRPHAAALLLQATAAAAFFAERGFPLSADDLDDARWDAAAGAARLRLSRGPRPQEDVPGGAVSLPKALAHVLERLFGRSGRLETEGARTLARA
ncbi:MAG: hypothetical protein ACM3NW_01050, partial [Syntrophomonadaceae bacterium]